MEKVTTPMVPPIMVQGVKINKIKTTTYLWVPEILKGQELESLEPKTVLKNLVHNANNCSNMSIEKTSENRYMISIDDIVHDTIIRTQWIVAKEHIDSL